MPNLGSLAYHKCVERVARVAVNDELLGLGVVPSSLAALNIVRARDARATGPRELTLRRRVDM